MSRSASAGGPGRPLRVIAIFESRRPAQPQRTEVLHRVERLRAALDRLAELLDVGGGEVAELLAAAQDEIWCYPPVSRCVISFVLVLDRFGRLLSVYQRARDDLTHRTLNPLQQSM